MKIYTCCFTGHRKITDRECLVIKERLVKEIVDLINIGVRYFGSGGALGFDTIAALTVLKLKQKYPHIRLIMVLPCLEQDKYWSDYDKIIYNDILKKADKVTYISEKYNKDCMFIRNRWLVDSSSYCIAYCNKNSGGTAYTVKYAACRGVKLINLYI